MAKKKTTEGVKVNINSSVLNKALKVVGAAIETNTLLPILANVHCSVRDNKITLMATNTKLTIVTEVACEHKEEVVFLFPYKEGTAITGSLANQPIMLIIGKDITIETDKEHFRLGAAEAIATFPQKKELESTFKIDGDNEFLYAMKSALKCVDAGELTVITDNVCIDIRDKLVSVVATDKHVLYRYKKKTEEKTRFSGMVDDKFIRAISHFESAEIYGNEEYIVAKSGDTEVITRQAEGKYVDYMMLFGEYELNCTVSPKDLIAAMNSILSFENKFYHACILEFAEGRILIRYDDADTNKHYDTEIKAEHKVETEKICLNAAFLKKMMSMVSHEEVIKMSVAGVNRIVHIDTEDKNTNLIINPIAIYE